MALASCGDMASLPDVSARPPEHNLPSSTGGNVAGDTDVGNSPPPPEAGAGRKAPTTQVESFPALDLVSLISRIRQSNALGFFTKLALKNAIDDLLAEIDGFHTNGMNGPIQLLREHYNLLLFKLLALLEEDDPALFRDIAASGEALWATLSNPITFKRLSSIQGLRQ